MFEVEDVRREVKCREVDKSLPYCLGPLFFCRQNAINGRITDFLDRTVAQPPGINGLIKSHQLGIMIERSTASMALTFPSIRCKNRSFRGARVRVKLSFVSSSKALPVSCGANWISNSSNSFAATIRIS